MGNKAEQIKKAEEALSQIQQHLNKYEELFKADGIVDSTEQAKLNEMQGKLQQAQNKLNELKGGGLTATQNKSTSGCDPDRVREIRENYESMISAARSLGRNVAADNLQRFIDGTGGVKQMDVSWLRDFGEIKSAESRILEYTQGDKNLKKWVTEVEDGQSVNKSDYWDADIRDYNPTSELAVASGASDMKGDVSMRLSRSGDIITIEGEVAIKWSDAYNWNAGQSFGVIGFGDVSDNDGIYLRDCGGARDFDMEASWKFDYNGTYDVSTGTWTSSEWAINGQRYTPEGGDISRDSR